ncbi:MAG: hypothetical protein IKB16_03245 [Lentisphaeria bacterium]|nr:hypothetical protein [Lentisphaeria bacterium]
MNCKCVLTLLAVAAAAVLSAGPVNTELKKGAMYRPDTKLFWRNMSYSNGLGRYTMALSISKPVGNKPQQASFGFTGGGFGFCDKARAFDLTVNGISIRKLNFQEKDFSLWSEGDQKGVEVKMNFDGAKIVTRFYMRPDSPILWGKVYVANDTLEPVQRVKFSATCLPSILAKINGKVKFHNVYQRKVKTPFKEYSASNTVQAVSAAENSFIFYDALYDGSPFQKTKDKAANEKNDKGWGPCMFLSDHKEAKKSRIHLRNDWTSTIDLEFGKEFKEYNFGYYNSPVRTKNDVFFKNVENNKNAFTFKK